MKEKRKRWIITIQGCGCGDGKFLFEGTKEEAKQERLRIGNFYFQGRARLKVTPNKTIGR